MELTVGDVKVSVLGDCLNHGRHVFHAAGGVLEDYARGNVAVAQQLVVYRQAVEEPGCERRGAEGLLVLDIVGVVS